MQKIYSLVLKSTNGKAIHYKTIVESGSNFLIPIFFHLILLLQPPPPPTSYSGLVETF